MQPENSSHHYSAVETACLPVAQHRDSADACDMHAYTYAAISGMLLNTRGAKGRSHGTLLQSDVSNFRQSAINQPGRWEAASQLSSACYRLFALLTVLFLLQLVPASFSAWLSDSQHALRRVRAVDLCYNTHTHIVTHCARGGAESELLFCNSDAGRCEACKQASGVGLACIANVS